MSYSWKQLLKFSNKYPPKNAILRTTNTENKYKAHKDELNKLGISINEYISNKLLFTSNDKIIITINDFPYDLNNDIKHLLCWINPNIKIGYNDVKEYVCNKMKYYDFNEYCIMFKNLPQNCSIDGIEHYHLFIKNISIDTIIDK
jgi:hypothetical protein